METADIKEIKTGIAYFMGKDYSRSSHYSFHAG